MSVLRAYRGPLAAAAGVAALVISRHRTSMAASGWTEVWPVVMALLPIAAAAVERRLLRRLGEPGLEQRVLDGYAWLALCAVEISFPFFATSLGTFLPALGVLLILADQAWSLSAWKHRDPRDTEAALPGPADDERNEQSPTPEIGSGPSRRRLWLTALLLGLLIPTLQLSGCLDAHKTFTGDEPAYLLVSLSLLEDGDLVMNNQYRGHQYTRFGTQKYRVFAHPGLDGRLYPHHNAGLPALLLPALALGLGDEARLALLVRGFLALLAALAVAETALLVLDLGGGRRAALWSAGLMGLTVPFAFYATQVYPEASAALCAAAAYRRILGLGAAPRLRPAAVAGLACGALIWLHYKFLPISALLAAAAGLRLASHLRTPRRALPALAAFGLALAAPAALFFLFVHATYGTWSPNVLQLGVGAVDTAEPVVLGGLDQRLWRTPLNFVGYFLDQRIGLLLYTPAFVLAVPGLAWLWRRRRLPALELPALALAPLALYAWVYWSMGGYGPPNRPAVPGIPFLAALAGLGCASLQAWGSRRLRDALLLPALLGSAAFLLHHDALYHPMSVRSETARNRLLAYHGPTSVDLTEALPAYLGESLNVWPNLLFPLGAALLVVGLLRLERGGRREPAMSLEAELRLGRVGLGLVAGLLLLCRLDAIARTPAQVERGAPVEALLLEGEAWVEESASVWVRGGGWARLLVPAEAAGSVSLRLEVLGPNRVALRSGGQLQTLDLPGAGSGFVELRRPWRLKRGGRSYVLVEAACTGGTPEPGGSRWLGVRLTFPQTGTR